MRELTSDDFKDIDRDPSWSPLDCLLVVAERASKIYEEEEKEEEKPFSDMSQMKLCKSEEAFKKPTVPYWPSSVIPKKVSMPTLTFPYATPHNDMLRNKSFLKRPIQETLGASSFSGRKRMSESDYGVETKKKISNGRSKFADNGPNPPPPLPEAFKDLIRELTKGKSVSKEKLVIQKRLFTTDVSKGHNRLSIPYNQIRESFLSKEEEDFLSHHKGKHMVSTAVEMIDSSREQKSTVSLRRWDMPKAKGEPSISYVVTGTWNTVKERNGLEKDMVVQIWAFRVDGELWFALVKVPTEQ